jgi:hypothetical protein
MALQIQQNLKRSKRKLSIILDLPDSSSLSQNPSISTSAEKKKKVSFFSQSQLTQNIQNIPIYSESSLSGDSESEIRTQKSQLFVEIPKKTSFDLSQYSELSSSVYSRTPLGLKDINLQLSKTVTDYIRKPDQKISWGCIKKWQKYQPNNHTSKYLLYYIYLFIILTLNLAPSVPNKSTAAPDINKLLLPKKEWPESFILNLTVKDIIRKIPEYIPIDIPFKKGGPRNID